MLTSHGGLDQSDRQLAAKLFPDEVFSPEVSRNEGLVSISDKTMEESLRWAQGTVTVDLTKRKILNGMVNEYTVEEYLDEHVDDGDDDFTEPNELTQIPINLSEFGFDEIEVVKDILNINEDNWLRFQDTIFQLVDG
jgi:hypothetical protein